MSEKHYDIDYLTDTVKILGQLKYRSYQYFNEIPSGSTIIDLGCGTGLDVINMANSFEKGKFKFIGIDHDPNMIKEGANAVKEDSDIKFLLSDALSLPFADGDLGGVRMERLVQHIAKPIALFKEVYRILGKEGRVVVMESDWNSLSFYNGDLSVADKLNSFLVLKKIKNGRAAQSLSNYLMNVGFSHLTMEIHPFVLTRYDDACKYLWIDKMIGEMLALNLIDEKEYNDFIESQKQADRLGFFACTMNIVIVSATK